MDLIPQKDVVITMDVMTKLGILVLPDQRLCLFGRLLNGLVLPERTSFQIPILKGLLTWYSPCLTAQQGYYQLNNECFIQRENLFLATFFRTFQYSPYTTKNRIARRFSERGTQSLNYLFGV